MPRARALKSSSRRAAPPPSPDALRSHSTVTTVWSANSAARPRGASTHGVASVASTCVQFASVAGVGVGAGAPRVERTSHATAQAAERASVNQRARVGMGAMGAVDVGSYRIQTSRVCSEDRPDSRALQ